MQSANRQSYGRKGFHLLVLPSALILLLVNTFPLLYSLYISFTNYSLAAPEAIPFVGFNNFVQAFKDPMFLNSLLITVKFTLGSVLCEFSLGLLIAVLLNRLNKRANLVLGIFLLPMMITPIIVGLLWRFMLNDQTGLVNYFLVTIGIGRFAFLTTADSALLAIIVADLWQWTPFVILLLYSGLQALPKEPYEAAELDGATGFQKFRHITLPALRNTMVICILIRGMDAFREYDKVYTMTYGGPGSSTETASFYIYRQGFVFFNTGFSSALSLIMLVLTIIVVQTSIVKLWRKSG
jgi:multiple sugar transport system permease protein